MRKILFITHDTTRTGAPLVLLYFIKWLKIHHQQIQITILALGNGDLKEEFMKVADFFLMKPKSTYSSKIRSKVSSILLGNEYDWMFGLAKSKFDLIYANTVVAIPIAVGIAKYNKRSKVIAHIHELETVIRLLLPDLKNFNSKVDAFISASEMVRLNLINEHSVAPGKITTIYEFCPLLPPKLPKSDRSFIVGASGTFHWRKGGDIFLQVARYLTTHHPEVDIKFRWVGSVSLNEKIIAENDIKKMGLEKRISFSGLRENPYEEYKEFDVFLLPSREDPFPLVCIEVGMMGIPIICWDSATGTSEILQNGGGVVATYLNIEDMVNSIINYYKEPALQVRHGKQNIIQFSKFTPENICPKIFDCF